ncbi:META domain-containing protein [Chitinophaga sancti]|uniref:Heat shock protein HslJ n=1 Tax=Chitinophaga sancti TaxID=1004 RepID=A0A1K1SUM3_9BACT|nr:META domain-containing protein [Chitinophaga sancti]WQD60546.1 META domain-containing protein [Chitinophaga sancti]WQG87326.1 META domain-containing protein [Chitinophaga sancti]SFW87940.1 Heat shock protein HslJ [Chitinophaga sancti]
MRGKITLGLLFLMACTSLKKVPDLGGLRWSLVQLQNEKLDSSPVYVQFDTSAHRFSGNAGCNKVSGNYTATVKTLTFEEVISTRMACVDTRANERESQLLRLLNNHTYAYDINGATLQLKDSGKVILQFKGF